MPNIEATDFTLPGLVADGALDIVATRYRQLQASDTGIAGGGVRLSLVCVHAVSYCMSIFLLKIFHAADTCPFSCR